MRLITAVVSASLVVASAGCPKTGTTPDKQPPLVRPAPVDAGVPVVKTELPAYKPKYTRKKVRLYTSGRLPWFRSRMRRPNLATLPRSDRQRPPKNLLSEIAAVTALKRTNPKKADYYQLKAVLAYRSYQRAKTNQKNLSALQAKLRAAKTWRDRYRWRKRVKVLTIQVRKNLSDAAAKYKELSGNADAKLLYPAVVDAMYHYGLVLEQQRQWAAALKQWESVIKEQPKSKAAAAAHLALAEYHFQRSSFGTARRHFEAATPDKTTVPRGRHWRALKHTWTLSRTRDGKRAWQELLKLPRTRFIKGMTASETRLYKQTVRRVVPWVYASAGKAAGALRALSVIDRRNPWPMMRELANVYSFQRQRKQAIAVYQQLLAKLPNDADVCLWRFYAVANRLVGKLTPATIKALEDVIAMYKKANAAHLLPSEGQRKCESAVRTISTSIARRLHRAARKDPTPGHWQAAEKLYQLHLDTFSPATRVHSDYAELHWRKAELEKDPKTAFELWLAASEHFVRLSHRNGWKKLQDNAKKAGAQALSNAAAILETGYIVGKYARDAAALYKRSCELGRSAGFNAGCDDEARITNPAPKAKPAPKQPVAPNAPTAKPNK